MSDKTLGLSLACYFGGMLVIAIIGWWRVRSCTTPEEKKKWADRVFVVQGLFVGGAMCAMAIAAKKYYGIPIMLLAGLAFGWLHHRFSFYCGNCGKHSTSQNWFSPHAPYHCPHCGSKLR
jgi:DNA-directed RNA polymerase subunit RPC12/RpoP